MVDDWVLQNTVIKLYAQLICVLSNLHTNLIHMHIMQFNIYAAY